MCLFPVWRGDYLSCEHPGDTAALCDSPHVADGEDDAHCKESCAPQELPPSTPGCCAAKCPFEVIFSSSCAAMKGIHVVSAVLRAPSAQVGFAAAERDSEAVPAVALGCSCIPAQQGCTSQARGGDPDLVHRIFPKGCCCRAKRHFLMQLLLRDRN